MDENVKVFEPKFVSISDVKLELKDKEIDLRKTIEKVISKDFGIGECCLVVVEDHDDEWYIQFDLERYTDEYYDKLEELKDEGKWIYIRAVYANREIAGHTENIYQYEVSDEEYENDDYVSVGVASCLGDCDLLLSGDYYTGDDTSDYGIMIENGKINFEMFIGEMFSSIDPITDLSEPLHALAIETMLDIIEFKD